MYVHEIYPNGVNLRSRDIAKTKHKTALEGINVSYSEFHEGHWKPFIRKTCWDYLLEPEEI